MGNEIMRLEKKQIRGLVLLMVLLLAVKGGMGRRSGRQTAVVLEHEWLVGQKP